MMIVLQQEIFFVFHYRPGNVFVSDEIAQLNVVVGVSPAVVCWSSGAYTVCYTHENSFTNEVKHGFYNN